MAAPVSFSRWLCGTPAGTDWPTLRGHNLTPIGFRKRRFAALSPLYHFSKDRLSTPAATPQDGRPGPRVWPPRKKGAGSRQSSAADRCVAPRLADPPCETTRRNRVLLHRSLREAVREANASAVGPPALRPVDPKRRVELRRARTTGEQDSGRQEVPGIRKPSFFCRITCDSLTRPTPLAYGKRIQPNRKW